MCNNKYYKQVDGVAMGSPFVPALANIVMCSFENKWLRDCLMISNLCSIDVMLMAYLFQADEFKEHLWSKHPNITFSIENKKDGSLPFLHVNIFAKPRNLQPTSIEKRASVGLYLKHIKLV